MFLCFPINSIFVAMLPRQHASCARGAVILLGKWASCRMASVFAWDVTTFLLQFPRKVFLLEMSHFFFYSFQETLIFVALLNVILTATGDKSKQRSNESEMNLNLAKTALHGDVIDTMLLLHLRHSQQLDHQLSLLLKNLNQSKFEHFKASICMAEKLHSVQCHWLQSLLWLILAMTGILWFHTLPQQTNVSPKFCTTKGF